LNLNDKNGKVLGIVTELMMMMMMMMMTMMIHIWKLCTTMYHYGAVVRAARMKNCTNG